MIFIITLLTLKPTHTTKPVPNPNTYPISIAAKVVCNTICSTLYLFLFYVRT